MSGKIKVGFGWDLHRFTYQVDPENVIKLGGIDVLCEYAVIAHSDGDVVLHALTDAILGTLGGGDIGDYFPPSEAKCKGKDSIFFLREALCMMREKGGVINNVDITIICEKPKLYGFKQLIQSKLMELLEIPKSDITVKAKTSEKIGAIGRCEGIATQVACTICF